MILYRESPPVMTGFRKRAAISVQHPRGSFELQTARGQIFGNLNEDVLKVLSAALVPRASVNSSDARDVLSLRGHSFFFSETFYPNVYYI